VGKAKKEKGRRKKENGREGIEVAHPAPSLSKWK
jgi:hypothetical protein